MRIRYTSLDYVNGTLQYVMAGMLWCLPADLARLLLVNLFSASQTYHDACIVSVGVSCNRGQPAAHAAQHACHATGCCHATAGEAARVQQQQQ